MINLARRLLQSKQRLHSVLSCQYSGKENCNKSVFTGLKTAPPVEVFHLLRLFQEDTHDPKVNLGIGSYRDEENKPVVFPVVKKCEFEIVKDKTLNHEYLPMTGNPKFTKAATELILGKNSKAIKENRVIGIQTLSGTGAIRLAAEFMCQQLKLRTSFMPVPTWENHFKIFQMAGFKQLKTYPYWNAKKRQLDMSKLLAALCEAPEGAVVLLHASAHNPTGMDPTKKEWKQIAEVIKQRKLFPFFDAAYQGFASGDPDRDAWAIRYFVDQGHETIIAQSFAKNMGLYNERVGNLVLVLKDKANIASVNSQLTILIRINYSNPPAFGCRIVEKVLTNEENYAEWLQTICMISERIKSMRVALTEKLKELETPGKWDHILRQCGMFSYLGLKPEQCEKLVKDKHIYLMKSSRVNICGLNAKNVDYVAESIDEVVKEAGSQDKKDC